MKNMIIPKLVLLTVLIVFTPVIGICASNVEGTYTNTGGMATLDLKSGGKAAFTLMGETFPCKYAVKGDKIALDCTPKGEKVDFMIHGDGSLTGPGFLGSMKKSTAGSSGTGSAPGSRGTGSAPGSSETGSAAAQVSGVERAAQDFALAEVRKHWSKAPEGWITARTYGSSFAPINVIRQFREITVEGVLENELTDSDRLNGFEWAGEVRFKKAPCREAGEPGIMLDGLPEGRNIMRQRGRWTQWVEFQPEPVQVQKVKGKWQVHEDTWLLRGKLPGPQDFMNAGVK